MQKRQYLSPVEEPQVLSLGNICMVDDLWTFTAQFIGSGWVWKDSMENIQLMGTRNSRRREPALHSELETLRWIMESMFQHSTCQNLETDYENLITMIKDPHAWPNFSTELEVIQALQICFMNFKISYIPRAQNDIVIR